MRSQKLYDYYNSIEWRQKARKYLKEARYVCEYCGADHLGLEAHHLHYCRIGNEQPGDLVATCKLCHPVVDHWRREAERESRRMYRHYRQKPKQLTLL